MKVGSSLLYQSLHMICFIVTGIDALVIKWLYLSIWFLQYKLLGGVSDFLTAEVTLLLLLLWQHVTLLYARLEY